MGRAVQVITFPGIARPLLFYNAMHETAKYIVGDKLETQEFGEVVVTEVFRGCQGRIAYTLAEEGSSTEYLILQSDMTHPS